MFFLLVAVPLLWLVAWAVIRHAGWAWLPVGMTAVFYPLLPTIGRAVDRFLSTGTDFLLFVLVFIVALYGIARLRPLPWRVAICAVVVPLGFYVITYVVVMMVLGNVS